MKPEIMKKLRKDRKMTQQQLADCLHLSKSTVAQWEQGKHQPKPDMEMMLARLFGVTLDFLNGDSTFSRFEEVMNQNYTKDATYMELFDLVLKLPEEYHSALKLQLDSYYALEREKKRKTKEQ